MQRVTVLLLPLAVLAAGILLTSVGESPTDEPLPVRIYRTQSAEGPPPFPVVERAAQATREAHDWTAMVAFLTDHVQRFPGDENNGYYLTVVGDLYRSHGSPEVARQYQRRALLAFPDVVVRSVSTHRVAIDSLLDIVDDPDERLEYLTRLEHDYADDIQPGLLAYYLAEAYAGTGRWTDAYDEYRTFLRYPATRVPGRPNARQEVTQRIAFYDSARSWTERDLNALVQSIKNALWRQDPRALLRYRAQVNFFTMSWEQELGDANSEIPSFDIAAFLRRSRVRFAQELEMSSNANEAYLRTWGWSHRIPTWYLYFRRVDFPADPEINGTWEWAGIYFGETI